MQGDRDNRKPIGMVLGIALLLAGCGGAVDTHWQREAAVPGSHFHGVHGLTFDKDDRLFVGDVFGQAIYEVDLKTKNVSTWVGPPVGEADDLEFGPDGTLVWTAFFAGEVRAQRPDGEIVTLASGHPGFNSLAFAPDGRLYATTVFLGDELYEIDLEGKKPARLVAQGFGGLNGFDFDADGNLYGPLIFKGKVARVDVESGEVTVIADGFGVPAAVNLNSRGEIYVNDTARGEMVRVHPETGAKTVVSKGAAMIDNLAFDSKDRLFITNASDNAILEIDVATGAETVHLAGLLSVPGDLAFDSERNRLVVPEVFSMIDNLVPEVFSIRAVELPGHGVSELARAFQQPIHFPYFVAAGSDWFAVAGVRFGDTAPGSVQVFNVASDEEQTLDGFDTPHGMVFEDANRLLVAEFAAGTVVRVDIRNPSEPEVVARDLQGPVGLALHSDGSLYVSELSAGTLSRLDLVAGTREVVARGLAQPEGIDVFPDGRIAVAEVGARRIVAIDPASGENTVLAEDLPIGLDLPDALPPVGMPTGVAAVDDDTVYFVSDEETAIYRLTRPGR